MFTFLYVYMHVCRYLQVISLCTVNISFRALYCGTVRKAMQHNIMQKFVWYDRYEKAVQSNVLPAKCVCVSSQLRSVTAHHGANITELVVEFMLYLISQGKYQDALKVKVRI